MLVNLSVPWTQIYRRLSQSEIKRYDQVFRYLSEYCLAQGFISDSFALFTQVARSNSFVPATCLTRTSSEFDEIEAPVGRKKISEIKSVEGEAVK